LRFFSTYILSIIIGLVILPVLVEVFHMDPSIAGALLIIICAFTSYIGHSRFSFRLK
jgi:putative flippase GtrA